MNRDVLIDHAVKNIWCNPEQDNQSIISLHRISRNGGEINDMDVNDRYLDLPEPGKRFHVYQIGQINPIVLGLLSKFPEWTNDVWYNVQDVMNYQKLMSDIYTLDGRQLVKSKCWYRYTRDRNLIVAVENAVNYGFSFNSTALYIRLYTSSYFQSARSSGEDVLYVYGKKISNSLDLTDMIAAYNARSVIPGHLFCFRNGFKIDRIDDDTISIGDMVEFVHDNSVKEVKEIQISELETFNSELDSVYKYLVHFPGRSSIIDYKDDIDVYIIHRDGINYQGHYYCQNLPGSVRMVTHRDYSIPVANMNTVANALLSRLDADGVSLEDLTLQFVIRHSGYERPLEYDNNRIFELYKMTDDHVLSAMVGVNATVEYWQATVLEKSAYCELMSARHETVDIQLVQDALGYNSMSRILGNTPSLMELYSGQYRVYVPAGVRANCTVYEYDIDGILLEHHYHNGELYYYALNPDARIAEIISGEGTNTPDVRFGISNIPVPLADNYRVYYSTATGGVSDNNWIDITDEAFYTVNNGILVWGFAETDHLLMVRTDATFLTKVHNLLPTDGYYKINLQEYEDRGTGVALYTMPVPAGELDVFMNGRSLILGLDMVLDFPNLYILTKKYITQPAESVTQRFDIRFTGFCKKDFTLEQVEDFGFIEHDVLSNNNRFDVRDDKVLRITCDGRLRLKDSLLFSEESSNISITNATNGLPYQIKDIVVPFKDFVNTNTYTLRAASQVIDAVVSSYLSEKLPEIDRGLFAIQERYNLVSPFIAAIITDILNGGITDAEVINLASDMDVIAYCSGYEPLLKYDPIGQNVQDMNFVYVVPHLSNSTISVSYLQYQFLTKVIRIYGNGLISLSPFVSIA